MIEKEGQTIEKKKQSINGVCPFDGGLLGPSLMIPPLGWPILGPWVVAQRDPGHSWALLSGIIKLGPAEAERKKEILERINDMINESS